ncbi:MAG TPA: alpha-galactosidase [Anaerolineae bacterium]|nr:alpha-galactosidase [Anaerolineae bacterium]
MSEIRLGVEGEVANARRTITRVVEGLKPPASVRENVPSLEAICHADGVTLAPGERLISEPLLVAADEDPLALLDRYATHLGERMEARVPPRPPTGWCSWYYFYGENSEADVLANMVGIARERLPLEVILIDDGYETAIGDWLTPDPAKFPQGMGWLAEQIRAGGYVPGLWIAPFAASAGSQLFADHPDWVIRDEDGQPLVAWHHFGEVVHALDLTHPAVQEWLRTLFHTLSDEWGYGLFKLDFLYAGALAGQRHDPQMTRAQALRRGLEIIREVVGEKFLLGCGAPLGPCVGLVDGMRIGPDVAINWRPFWPDLSASAAENGLRNVVSRAFLHNRLWANDPDCVLVRTRDDESDLVLNEMRTLVSLVGLSGGLVLSGDNFPSIRPGRLKYLRQILPPYGQAAIPLDLFENELPELFVLPVQREFGAWLVVGVINWGDRTRKTTVDLARLGLEPGQPYHAYHYWRRRYLGVVRDRVTIPRHQPHETALLLLKPASEEPQFLTSTFHVTQGGVEVKAVDWTVDDGGRRVVVTLEKAGRQFGELLFAVPEPWRVAQAWLNGRRRGVNHIAPGVVGMGFHLEERAVVEMAFER